MAGHDADIRFRLGLFVESDRHLRPHVPAGAERPLEGPLDQANARGVRAVLRLLDDHLAAEQLDPVVGPEDLGLCQSLVLQPCPLPRADRRLAHLAPPAAEGSGSSRPGQRVGSDTSSPLLRRAALAPSGSMKGHDQDPLRSHRNRHVPDGRCDRDARRHTGRRPRLRSAVRRLPLGVVDVRGRRGDRDPRAHGRPRLPPPLPRRARPGCPPRHLQGAEPRRDLRPRRARGLRRRGSRRHRPGVEGGLPSPEAGARHRRAVRRVRRRRRRAPAALAAAPGAARSARARDHSSGCACAPTPGSARAGSGRRSWKAIRARAPRAS